MAGEPGGGCDDPRAVHKHWCKFCGALLLFSRDQCRLLVIVPPCPRCGSTSWGDEIDELTAPDFRETPDG